MATTTAHGYKITATYKGDKAAPWSSDRAANNYNRHVVTISRDGKRLSFDFWASEARPEVREAADLRSAFASFLSDAIAGLQTLEDFCSEFGYDEDSRTAERTWTACQKAAEKAERFGLDENGLCDLVNALES